MNAITHRNSSRITHHASLPAMRAVLAAAVGLHFRPETMNAFRARLSTVPVDGRLVEFADRCYVLPLLASALRRSGVSAPEPETEERLVGAYYACAARRVALLALMECVADRLSEEGVPFLFLKGAALEVLAPRAPAVRVTADLDLLVPHGQMARVETLLERAGFRPRYERHQLAFRRHGHHAVPYEAERGLGTVEIHETLAPRCAPARLPVEPFWRRSRSVAWRGREIRVPAPEDLVLHTCIHYGLLHPYNTLLRRLWDLALLVTHTPIDWEYVVSTAPRWGARRVLAQALVELQFIFPEAVGCRLSAVREKEAVGCQLSAVSGDRGPVLFPPHGQPTADSRQPREEGPSKLTADSRQPTAEEWPLFDEPYSALAAFCLEQQATDSLWGRLCGTWHFLLPGPHETVPMRADGSHWLYLARRCSLRSWLAARQPAAKNAARNSEQR